MTGTSDTASLNYSSHAFLYSNGQMLDLGALGEGVYGSISIGLDINNSGQVTGSSSTANNDAEHAFLYSNGQMLDLGTLGGDHSYGSYGSGLNDAGQVVGSSYSSNGAAEHAFLYRDGQMNDLNDLIDPALQLTLGSAAAINDSGQIVANKTSSCFQDCHGYLLTPIPEPSTVALIGVALLGLAPWVRASKS